MREAKVDEVLPCQSGSIEKLVPLSTSLIRQDARSYLWNGLTRTNQVEDLVAIGDEVDVKIIKIDERGRAEFHEGTLTTSAKPEHSEAVGEKGSSSWRSSSSPQQDHKTLKKTLLVTHKKNMWIIWLEKEWAGADGETINIVKENNLARTSLEVLWPIRRQSTGSSHRVSTFVGTMVLSF